MKIGIIGTGMVGRTLAHRLDELKHEVVVGTRDPEKTMVRTDSDMYGNPPYGVWSKVHPDVQLKTFAKAAAFGDLIINATTGLASRDALQQAGANNLGEKVLIDVANPLDFSQGMPPLLGICNTDSLGEQIQQAFPRVKVVKTLNTMGAPVMVHPEQVADGQHDVFICGNDATAKRQVEDILRQFGWKQVIDLGDISNARGMEMLLPIWVRLFGKYQTPMFNFNIAR